MQPEPRQRPLRMLLPALGMALLVATAGMLGYLRINGAAAGGKVIRAVPVALREAPQPVREAAGQLAGSRVGYVIPAGEAAYLVVTTGGEPLRLAGVRRVGGLIRITLRPDTGGERLLAIRLDVPITDPRLIQVRVEGAEAPLPMVANLHQLPLMALPEKEQLALVSPRPRQVVGQRLEVAGYARIGDGRFTIAVVSAGKGQVLGEARGVIAAAVAPDWGSFRAEIPLQIPAGVTSGVLLVYDEETRAKTALPIAFGGP